MKLLITILVTFLAGMGAGLGTGFAGMSAAAVISPILITFLGIDPYMAVGIALSSDVLASAVSAYTYGKNKNLDVKNGLIMMVTVLLFTVVGSYISSLVPSHTMGSFSVFMTFLLGIKFIVKPVMTTKEAMGQVSSKKRALQSVICGVMIGFICGFVGAGGGMMMLLILTSVLGYELKLRWERVSSSWHLPHLQELPPTLRSVVCRIRLSGSYALYSPWSGQGSQLYLPIKQRRKH